VYAYKWFVVVVPGETYISEALTIPMLIP